MNRKYGLDQVSVRLVKEQPLLANEGITNPETAVRILADAFRDYDRSSEWFISEMTTCQSI